MVRLLAIVVIVSSCAPRVVNYVNNQSNFSEYNTYVLLGLKGRDVGENADPSDLLLRLESRIDSEMDRRGYSKSDEPDLILRYEVISSSKTERNNNSPFFDPYFYQPTLRTITESVILLEMTDFKTKKLVWQASLDLREHNKITKKKDFLQSAVISIFNTYLYRAGKRQPDETLYIK